MSDDPISLSKQLGSSVTVVRSGRRGKDVIAKNEEGLLRSNALTVDDNQTTAFDSIGKGKLVKPTYDPVVLALLTQQNNTLLQCSAAMEVNVDGTGYEIERADGESLTDDDKKKIKEIKQFFDESYPGESFVSQRRAMRRDIEGSGCGYLEVIRDVQGEITFTRRLDAKLMRLVALDAPVMVEKTITRMGKEKTVKMVVRERRFCMQVGSKFRFFKEFGASRDVDLITGEWLNPDGSAVPGSAPFDATTNNIKITDNVMQVSGNPLAVSGMVPSKATVDTTLQPRAKGTEVIFFGAVPDVHTGYFVPRWINQLPSVLGSRKAEEFNLEFFNSGGLPPALILVQGGQLSPDSKVALTNYLSGKAKFKQRGVIAEVFSTGGSLDGSGGTVRVTVERFGDERSKDSMFSGYDKNCADHVRGAYRLPPLFLGLSADHNFATAYASYMVAEAQVFRPEREEFDEIINVKVMREIAPEYLFRSLPLQINDVEQQLKALALVKEFADPEEFLRTVNEIASVTLTPRDGLDEDDAVAMVNQLLGREAMGSKLDQRDAKTQAANEDGTEEVKVRAGKNGRIAKLDDGVLTELAQDWADYTTGQREFNPASVSAMRNLIKALQPGVRNLFNSVVASKMVAPSHDPHGTATLLAAAGACLDS